MKGNEGREFRDGTVLSRRKRFGWHSMGCALVESLGRKKEEKDSVPFPFLRKRGRSPISTGYQTRDWVLGFGSSTFGHWFTTTLSKVVLKGTCSFWFYSTFYVGSDLWPARHRGNFRSTLLVLGGRSNLMVKLGRMSSYFSHSYWSVHGRLNPLMVVRLLRQMSGVTLETKSLSIGEGFYFLSRRIE